MAITKNLVNIGDANISNTLTAEALKKRNGTNKQILLADGTTKDMGTGTTTFLRNDGTWATPPTGTDEKQTVTESNDTVYLSGVSAIGNTDVGYANASVYMYNGNLYASSLTVTSLGAPEGTITNANISKLNGSDVPINPQFTDTLYTHPTKTQSDTTSTAKPSHGGSFTVVDGVTRDGQGHVSGINVKTVTLPGSGNTDTKQSISASTGKVYLTGVTSTSITGVGYANANVYMQNGGLVASSLSVTTATISTLNGSTVPNNPKFSDTVYTHPGKTQADTTSTAKPSHGGSFTVVDGVTRDGQGHVSGINVKTVTLPGSGNTDEKVKVTKSTTNASYPLMAVTVSSPTSGATYGAIYDTGITMNPNTHLVSVSGKVNAASGFFQTSDINKKNIIGELDLDKAYDLIDKCQTILYTLKDDDSNKEQIGLIAQEVKDFFPELITEDNDGSLSLDYSRLSVIILKVLKDVINRIKILESKYIETYY